MPESELPTAKPFKPYVSPATPVLDFGVKHFEPKSEPAPEIKPAAVDPPAEIAAEFVRPAEPIDDTWVAFPTSPEPALRPLEPKPVDKPKLEWWQGSAEVAKESAPAQEEPAREQVEANELDEPFAPANGFADDKVVEAHDEEVIDEPEGAFDDPFEAEAVATEDTLIEDDDRGQEAITTRTVSDDEVLEDEPDAEISGDVAEEDYETDVSLAEEDSGAVAAREWPAYEEPDRRTVLVVDDSPTVCKIVSMTLEKRGHKVLAASDGMVAMSKIAECKPDLILLDITMPKMDGYQLCKLIKGYPATKKIPVVMLSGKDGFLIECAAGWSAAPITSPSRSIQRFWCRSRRSICAPQRRDGKARFQSHS